MAQDPQPASGGAVMEAEFLESRPNLCYLALMLASLQDGFLQFSPIIRFRCALSFTHCLVDIHFLPLTSPSAIVLAPAWPMSLEHIPMQLEWV